MNRAVIVGASAGGLAVAEALRRVGYAGAITLIGAESHLPYDRPPLSKQVLSGKLEPDRLPLRRRDELDAHGLELRLGVAATGLDLAGRVVELADGTRVPYEGLVIATGVRPRLLPGSDGVCGVHTLRTLEDALALRARLLPGRRLVVVGAGFVGAEVAGVARRLGMDVTVLEAGQVPLEQAVGEAAGRFLASLHDEHGVRLRAGAAVAGIISRDGRVTGVRLADGTPLPADDVLVAIGSVPNTEWLYDSGLNVLEGLVCDVFSAAAPGVYGVGDVARWRNLLFGREMRIEHRTNAAEQGIAVARNLLSPHAPQPFAPVPYFWSDQYGLRIQAYGYLRDHNEAVVAEGDMAQRRFLVAYRKGRRLAGVLAVGMPPPVLRAWRARIAAGAGWDAAVAETVPA